MTKRYYVPDLPQLGGTISLPPSEARHAIRVMRIKVGEAIELFNGQGLQAEAMIEDVKRNACICQANAACSIDREPKRKVRLAIALLENPANTIECIAPILAQASIAIASSGIIGI